MGWSQILAGRKNECTTLLEIDLCCVAFPLVETKTTKQVFCHFYVQNHEQHVKILYFTFLHKLAIEKLHLSSHLCHMTGLSITIIINQEIFKLAHFSVFNQNGEKWGKHIIYLRSSNVLLLLKNCWDLISDYENIICEYREAINLQCPRKRGGKRANTTCVFAIFSYPAVS